VRRREVHASASHLRRPSGSGSNEERATPTCIFCDRRTGPVQYLWPEWLCQVFTDRLGEWSNLSGSDDGFVERLRTEVDRTIDCVCEPCSHGWMRRLDDKVSPFLASMMVGTKTRLSPVQQRLLARWSAKIAALTECVYDSPVHTPPSVGEYLRRVGVHPGTQVLVGRYDGTVHALTHDRDLFRRTFDGDEHYLTQSSFVIGKVLIQVLADPQEPTTPALGDDVTRVLIALVPSHDRKVDWPPAMSIDDSLYHLVRLGPM